MRGQMKWLFRMRCPAPPHDLLKLVYWPGHDDPRWAKQYIPQDIRKKCPELWRWIAYHRKRKSYKIPDILSAVLARPHMRYNYWDVGPKGWGSRDPFLVKVFGDIVFWPEEERLRVFNSVLELYRRYGEEEEVNVQANELLANYPQDSRFPIVGLKVHHYLSWILRERLMGKDANTLYLMRIVVPPLPLAHRLKDLRTYQGRRRSAIRALRAMLGRYHPISIGDELYLILTEHDDLNALLNNLARNVRIDIDVIIYEYRTGGRVIKICANGEERYYRYVIDSPPPSRYSFGEAVEWGVLTESALWTKHLDAPYVAWVFIRPQHDLLGSAEEFIDYAEGVLSKMERQELPEKVESDVPVSPDILVAVAEGYGEFLSAIAERLRMRREDIVFISFDQTLFIRGLIDPEWGVRLYTIADDVRADLHISTAITIVITQPKHPFWHVLRLIGDEEKFDGVIFALGGKMVRLKGEDIGLLRQVTQSLRGVSRGAFHRIIRASRREEPEVLKFMIEGMAQDRKLPPQAAQKLCWLIDELCKRYGEDVGDILPQALRALVPWTRAEGRR